MDNVKIKDKKTGAIKEVKKSLASDFIGTGKFELVEDKKVTKATEKPSFNVDERQDNK